MVASLTRIFGVHNLALAEDVAQEAFCRALEVWSLRGIPDKPQAWLMQTAKNRALDVIRRQRTAASHLAELEWMLRQEQAIEPAIEELFRPDALKDDLLRMMFACCDPRLPERAQVALILQILCGFSAGEASAAFMTSRAAMEKRLTRAKKVLATSKRLFDTTRSTMAARRLPAVQRALYLLFNEGYHGASAETPIRAQLCREAMRLTAMLLKDPGCATPATHALGALMCLHAARLPARMDGAGDLVALRDQDRRQWDQNLIVEGFALLKLAAAGPNLTAFHLEAAIAATHAKAESCEATDWGAIVSLYDQLMRVQPSPIVALNRAIAVGQHLGPRRGLTAIHAIEGPDRLTSYPFYFASLGELECTSGNIDAAIAHFRHALAQARSSAERRHYRRRLEVCNEITPTRDGLELMWSNALEAFSKLLESDAAN